MLVDVSMTYTKLRPFPTMFMNDVSPGPGVSDPAAAPPAEFCGRMSSASPPPASGTPPTGRPGPIVLVRSTDASDGSAGTGDEVLALSSSATLGASSGTDGGSG